MSALRDGLMQPRLTVDMVPFEDGNRLEVIRENTGGHQPCEAPADDDRLLAEVVRHTFPSMDHVCGNPSHTRARRITHGPEPTRPRVDWLRRRGRFIPRISAPTLSRGSEGVGPVSLLILYVYTAGIGCVRIVSNGGIVST
jgi:hypothetical protein